MSHFKMQSGSVMASPNIIPMADIMLVLLIIFMVVTPLLHPGAPVELAQVTNPVAMPNADRDDALIVGISRSGDVFLGNKKTPLAQIASLVRDGISNRVDKTIFIKSDARARYSDVVNVVNEVRAAGVEDVGLLTDKILERTPPPIQP